MDNLQGAFPVVMFGLGGERLAVEADMVREILDLVPVTDVPHAQPYVGGLINVRGKVVPLADLRLKLGMEITETTIDSRILVLEVDLGEPVIVGVMADKVYEVAEFTPADLTEAPRIGIRWRPEFIRGIGKQDGDFVILLDVSRFFSCHGQGSVAAAEAPSANR